MKVINENQAVGSKPTVYVIQEIPGSQAGNPKINIMGASSYGKFNFLLPEVSQSRSGTIEQATPIIAGSPVSSK